MALPNPLTAADALRILREVIREGAGKLVFSDHLFERQDLRHVTPRDVERALVQGRIDREPVWNDRYSNWETRVELSVDGANIGVGLAFEEDGGIRPLTIVRVTTVWLD
jgi:hypothetical protein